MGNLMQPSYCWNGEAGNSWGQVFRKSCFRTSFTTRSDPLCLMHCYC